MSHQKFEDGFTAFELLLTIALAIAVGAVAVGAFKLHRDIKISKTETIQTTLYAGWKTYRSTTLPNYLFHYPSTWSEAPATNSPAGTEDIVVSSPSGMTEIDWQVDIKADSTDNKCPDTFQNNTITSVIPLANAANLFLVETKSADLNTNMASLIGIIGLLSGNMRPAVGSCVMSIYAHDPQENHYSFAFRSTSTPATVDVAATRRILSSLSN